MITLTEAFRLCDINQEHITLVDVRNPKTSVWGWSEDFKKKLDFSQISVLKIRPRWSFEGEWIGMEFVVNVVCSYYNKVFKHENFENHLDY